MDNLKSGVLAPDLWNPTINKTCAEMAEHYGVFIDPCRVATPTDKGKVERFVPSARELFRKLRAPRQGGAREQPRVFRVFLAPGAGRDRQSRRQQS